MAPRQTRSLLRRLLGAYSAALLAKLGVGRLSDAEDATAGIARAQAEFGEAAIAGNSGARAGRRDLDNHFVHTAKALALCGIGATALWYGAATVRADTTPPPTTPTTTTEAPPPDPYKPPAPSAKPKPAAPHRVAPVVRSAPATPARTFTPSSAPVAPRPAVRTSRPKPTRHAKAVRHRPKQPARRAAKSPPVITWLAPLSRLVAAAPAPLTITNDRENPYLWSAGIAFAFLAVAALGLQMLSVRYFDLELE